MRAPAVANRRFERILLGTAVVLLAVAAVLVFVAGWGGYGIAIGAGILLVVAGGSLTLSDDVRKHHARRLAPEDPPSKEAPPAPPDWPACLLCSAPWFVLGLACVRAGATEVAYSQRWRYIVLIALGVVLAFGALGVWGVGRSPSGLGALEARLLDRFGGRGRGATRDPDRVLTVLHERAAAQLAGAVAVVAVFLAGGALVLGLIQTAPIPTMLAALRFSSVPAT